MTKHNIDPKEVVGLSMSYSIPTYTGNGGNRVGSTTVTLVFTLYDGTFVTDTEKFSNINTTTTKSFIYTIGNYDVAVTVTVTAEGKNNSMNITGATAEITGKVLNQ